MSRNEVESDMMFRAMSLWLRLREWFGDPRSRLIEAGLEKGQTLLDYGCGIGSYAIPAARIVEEGGLVYALDIHPLAIEAVWKRSAREKLTNIRTICSGRDTKLPDNSVDVVLLYDVLHSVHDKQGLLQELHRVLKPNGRLSIVPDHMTRDDLLETLRAGGRFSLQTQHGEVFEFKKPSEA
jgi:ubiquinone/menaquinone biosynthesis C-methylase UbiE